MLVLPAGPRSRTWDKARSTRSKSEVNPSSVRAGGPTGCPIRITAPPPGFRKSSLMPAKVTTETRVLRESRLRRTSRAAAISAARIESPGSSVGSRNRSRPTTPLPLMSEPLASLVEPEVSRTSTTSKRRNSPSSARARPAMKAPFWMSSRMAPSLGSSISSRISVESTPAWPSSAPSEGSSRSLGAICSWLDRSPFVAPVAAAISIGSVANAVSGFPKPLSRGASRASSTAPIGPTPSRR